MLNIEARSSCFKEIRRSWPKERSRAPGIAVAQEKTRPVCRDNAVLGGWRRGWQSLPAPPGRSILVVVAAVAGRGNEAIEAAQQVFLAHAVELHFAVIG
jgi:hypothetical protein